MTHADGTTIPEASLANFLAGLRSQGLIQMGVLADPLSGKCLARPGLARYTLQILRILRDKTVGNRSPEEDALIEAIVGELEALLGEQAF